MQISTEPRYNAAMPGGRPPTKKAPPFGERLATLRKQKGMSQGDFALAVGISRQMVVYYERRAKKPSADFVQKAAAILGVSADQLLGSKPLATRKPGPVPKLDQRIEQIKNLPPAKQKLVLDFLDTVLQAQQAS